MRETLKDRVENALLKRIVYLEYEPGALISETDLCSEFQVSRTPLREALLELRTLGLVDIVPRSGTYVSKLDLVELRDLYVVKQGLEGIVAALAAPRITSASLNELTEILRCADVARSDGDLPMIVQCDQKFHEVLYRHAHNKPLLQMLKIAEFRCLRGWYYFIKQVPELQDSAENLKEVKAALEVKNAISARQAMENHVGKFIDTIRQVLL